MWRRYTPRSAICARVTLIVSCLAVGALTILADACWAEVSAQDQPRTPDWVILSVFGIGIFAILASWIIIPIVFAYRCQLLELLDLVKRGQVLKVVTVLYVVLIIFTLGLLNILKSDHLSTLLAAIIGYVLGESAARGIGDDSEKSPPQSKEQREKE
jgi:hypothetical protein